MMMFMPFGGGGGDDNDDNDSTSTVEASEAKKDFNARFSPNREGVALTDEQVATLKAAKPAEKKDEPKPGENNEQPPSAAKLPGGNLKSILEAKRKAEAEGAELRTKLDKFEKEEKPALEKKVSDLEAKIAEGGHSPAQLKALEDKLSTAEEKLAERETALVNENRGLRERLNFHDIQSDPDFQTSYVKPMSDSFGEATDPIKGDPAKMQLMRKALIANSAALGAPDAETRLAQEKERNAILSQISDSLDEFSRDQFVAGMNGYIRATKQHAAALVKHEETRQEIIKKRTESQTRQRTDIFSQWTKHNDTVATVFDAEAEIDDETAKIIKDLKLEPEKESKEASLTIKKIITGQAGMVESVEMLQRGRLYPVVKAKLAASEHKVKELEATIAKLRGTKATGDSKVAKSETGGESREDFNSRFRASRPGGMRG